MALSASNMTRSSSSDSSALSNILVGVVKADDSSSDHAPASTPPTSMNDSTSLGSAKAAADAMDVIEEEISGRPKRARSSISTYNLKKLSEAQQTEFTGNSRNVSGLTGRTLVHGEEEQTSLGDKVDNDLEMDWEDTNNALQRTSPRIQRRPSVKERVKKAAGKVSSVLGKRSREVMEAGKRKLTRKEEESSPPQKKVLKELDMGTKGVLDEMDLSDEEFDLPAARPAKKAKTSGKEVQATKQDIPTGAPDKKANGKAVKKWQKEGLYVGQEPDMDPAQVPNRKKLQKKRPGSSSSDEAAPEDESTAKGTFMNLPMFNYLDKTRDFNIPFDIYAPSAKRGDEKPKDWMKLNRNRLVGEAKDLWEKEDKLPASSCVCEPPAPGEQSCGEDCLNHVMQYECNEDNCNLPASQCSNRAFAELGARVKKNGLFDVGVEVVKTDKRGFGIRSCRTFAPNQIIMEYTGEIISEGECQRRMHVDYKDKQSYYLMELERGLVIDGTKGSMARFVNHSCGPNCEVRMMKVNGTPRMAVFAGDNGVMTGEELTYDYNFDNFGTTKQACYCGAPTCRGFLGKRLNAAEQKKQAREATERKRKAAEEAKKNAETEAKKQKAQKDRGASWRGWVAVDDPDMKEQLKAEKKEREEAEKGSSRAQRLAARRTSLPASETKTTAQGARKSDAKRRKTTHLEPAAAEEGAVAPIESTKEGPTAEKQKYSRTFSSGSKFTEDFTRPVPARRTSTIIKQTEVSISTTDVREETRLLGEDSTAAGAEDESGDATAGGKSGLSRTTSKGREVIKNVHQAVKNGLLGGDKAKARSGSGKLKQSTLSFAKIN